MINKRLVLIIILLAILALSVVPRFIPLGGEKKGMVSITFDTEYPYGVPSELIDKVNESAWIDTINELNALSARYNIRFQFNVVGKTAEKYPDLIRKISENNDISCHSYSHLRQTELNREEKQVEIGKCREALENITSKKVYGNRFPYTDWEEESFDVLYENEYKWDSSLWAPSLLDLKPYEKKSIAEFPILTKDDWSYFINDNKTNSSEFYDILYEDVQEIKDQNVNYVVLLHPWVLSLDKTRIEGLEEFIKKLKYDNVNIKSLDEIYKGI